MKETDLFFYHSRSALNTIDKKTASEIIKIFTEVIIAPEISDEAKEIFKTNQ